VATFLSPPNVATVVAAFKATSIQASILLQSPATSLVTRQAALAACPSNPGSHPDAARPPQFRQLLPYPPCTSSCGPAAGGLPACHKPGTLAWAAVSRKLP
jgi:hypothetical protein